MTDFLDEYIPTVISEIKSIVHNITADTIIQADAYQSCFCFTFCFTVSISNICSNVRNVEQHC